MTPRSSTVSVFGLLLLAQAQSLPAQTPAVPEATTRPQVLDEEEEFVELLEFLGELTTKDGAWVDPGLLESERGDARRVAGRVDAEVPAERVEAGERCDERCE